MKLEIMVKGEDNDKVLELVTRIKESLENDYAIIVSRHLSLDNIDPDNIKPPPYQTKPYTMDDLKEINQKFRNVDEGILKGSFLLLFELNDESNPVDKLDEENEYTEYWTTYGGRRVTMNEHGEIVDYDDKSNPKLTSTIGEAYQTDDLDAVRASQLLCSSDTDIPCYCPTCLCSKYLGIDLFPEDEEHGWSVWNEEREVVYNYVLKIVLENEGLNQQNK